MQEYTPYTFTGALLHSFLCLCCTNELLGQLNVFKWGSVKIYCILFYNNKNRRGCAWLCIFVYGTTQRLWSFSRNVCWMTGGSSCFVNGTKLSNKLAKAVIMHLPDAGSEVKLLIPTVCMTGCLS